MPILGGRVLTDDAKEGIVQRGGLPLDVVNEHRVIEREQVEHITPPPHTWDRNKDGRVYPQDVLRIHNWLGEGKMMAGRCGVEVGHCQLDQCNEVQGEQRKKL